MMAEHTPGPWQVLLHSEGETTLNVIAGEPTYIGSTTRAKWVAEFDADSLEGQEGENDANARLVAVSPDLLQIAVGVRWLGNNIDQIRLDPGAFERGFRVLVEAAEAVVARYAPE